MRLIDADALLKAIHEARYVKGKPINFMTIIKIKELIFKAPAIDAVPVVRCKDCRHNYGRTHKLSCGDIVCDYHMSDGFEENDFCSYGALMDGDSGDEP